MENTMEAFLEVVFMPLLQIVHITLLTEKLAWRFISENGPADQAVAHLAVSLWYNSSLDTLQDTASDVVVCI